MRLDLDVDSDCRLEVVVAVEANVRLDDRHEPLVLADERVSVGGFSRKRRDCGCAQGVGAAARWGGGSQQNVELWRVMSVLHGTSDEGIYAGKPVFMV